MRAFIILAAVLALPVAGFCATPLISFRTRLRLKSWSEINLFKPARIGLTGGFIPVFAFLPLRAYTGGAGIGTVLTCLSCVIRTKRPVAEA